MRFVAREYIKPYSILAQPVLGINGEVLLTTGSILKPQYIRHLKKLGVVGVYINDELSEDLDIVSAISHELKSQAVRSISSTFAKVLNEKGNPKMMGMKLHATAKQIVDEIISHGEIMLNLFDMKVYDSYTFYHCVNVTVLSVVMGLGLGYSHKKLVDLAYAALMHDIGKVWIAPEIINKPCALTPEEYEVVKQHPKTGYEYVRTHLNTIMPELAARGVLEHHERVDGSGYPEGKTAAQITETAKILAIADVYDALASDRPYRKGLFPVEAIEYVQGNCDTHFDFNIVQVFVRKVALFPVGSFVLLSNGATALVVENFEGLTQRPSVRVFMHDDVKITPYMLHLSREAFDVTVVASVNM